MDLNNQIDDKNFRHYKKHREKSISDQIKLIIKREWNWRLQRKKGKLNKKEKDNIMEEALHHDITHYQ